MEPRGYFFIDGSCLLNHIFTIWNKEKIFNGKPLDINIFTNEIFQIWSRYVQNFIRVNFYFRKGDPRISNYLKIPKSNIPGQKEHWEIIECGEKILKFLKVWF